ncbi:MAG: Methionyl-tRNA formyltransferase [Parcubacteria group bacterium GW2011_GWA2_43_9b]|nr:MAG: Methionyl-tRNA formyltransferase [Parcubacteria group bacterium GW2011_GWA2_43_9b]
MPQDDSQATYAKIITKEDGKIDWRKSAQAIERQIRAYAPWPGNFSKWHMTNGEWQTLKILDADIKYDALPPYAKGGWGVKILSLLRHHFFSNHPNPPLQGEQKRQPGKIFLTNANDLAIQTGDGSLIIKTLQLEGGKILSAQDFLRGHKDTVGQILT